LLLECFRLGQNSWANGYYSAAVKSMLGSLHNFFFVSSDPGGLVSLDKPPLGLWLQTVSAAVFGFHPLSLLVPEALCVVAAVGVVYWVVAPRFGCWAGVGAAATLGVFPALVASGRDNNLDALLILLMVLACLVGLRAIETGGWRWLVATALLVGLAFNTKALAASLVVPGLAVGWLVCAPGSLRRRVGLLVGAGVVLVVVSLVWLVAVDLTPAAQRPYVGASLDNSELSLSFGHNGFGRVLGERGAPVQTVTVVPAQGSLRSAGALSSTGHPGLLRLFGLSVGDQGAWLLPFALFGLVAIGLVVRGGGRRDKRLGVLLVLGGWFVVEAVVLSVSTGIVHPYYVSALGPGVAALVGGGAAAFVELGRRSRAYLVLPAGALIVTVAVAIMLLHREYDYLHWLWPVVIGIVGAAVVMMLWQPRAAAAAIAAGLAASLLIPAIYSATVWQVPVNGTFPVAGPYIQDNLDAYGIPPDDVDSYRTLIRYVRPREPGSRWDVLTQGSNAAAAVTLLGGRAAALGGYGTTDPVLSPTGLARIVARGETRFVALGGGYASRGGNAASAAVAAVCRRIAPQHWRSPHNFGTATRPHYAYPHGGWNLVLYDCGGRSREIATAS
jgi:4-amino-4-deoxy-L-arabinose transferase-like glycosyltransferase